MTEAVLADTDVMVDYLRGRGPAVRFVQRHEGRIILPAVVVAELFAGVRDGQEREILDDLVGLFDVVAVSAEIARRGGLLRRDFGPSHGVGLADALIAATAEITGARLATLNVKHYPMIRPLKPAYREG